MKSSPLLTLSPEGESGEDFIMRNINPKKCRKDIFVVNKSISWGCFSTDARRLKCGSICSSLSKILKGNQLLLPVWMDPLLLASTINLFTEMWDPYNGGEQVFPTAPCKGTFNHLYQYVPEGG